MEASDLEMSREVAEIHRLQKWPVGDIPVVVATGRLTILRRPSKLTGLFSEGYPSGQRGQTVNLLA